MTGPDALFVYGTLMSGHPEHGMLVGLRREPATVTGRLYHLPAGYPAITLGGDAHVQGELVYGVSSPMLSVLDRYEGIEEGLYRREIVRAWLPLRRYQAYIYVMDDPERRGGQWIRAGRWRSARGAHAWKTAV